MKLNKTLSLILLIFLFFQMNSGVYSADTQEDLNSIRSSVLEVQGTNTNLPNSNNQKGSIGNIISKIFDENGKIGNIFLKFLGNRSDTSVLRWSGGQDGQLVQGSIFDNGTNVSIGGTPLTNRKLSVYGDINFSGNLYRNGVLVDFAGKFVDGTNTNNAVYTAGNVGIGKQPTQALDVNGTILATNFSGNGSQITALNATNILSGIINTSRLPSDVVKTTGNQIIGGIKTFSTGIVGDGSSITNINGDNIQDNTIDGSEIQNGTITSIDIANDTITAADIAPNGVGDSEMIDNPTFANIRSTGNYTINNGSPTVYLQDTDSRSAMVHVNSNQFYVLRGSGNNSTTWETTGGVWPLQIDLENNNATFGGKIYMINQTNSGDSVNTVATKGYVDSRAQANDPNQAIYNWWRQCYYRDAGFLVDNWEGNHFCKKTANSHQLLCCLAR